MPKTHSPGDRIAELRKTYSISRETLAERSGLNIELIRCIEEDGHIPDLAPLVKISRALGVRIGVLMDDHEELGPVVTRAGEAEKTPRFVTGLPGAVSAKPEAAPDAHSRQGLNFHALAADKGGRHMEPFIVDIEADAEQDKSTHEGEEFIHVLSGKLSLEYGKNTYILEAGDSVYYDSIVPHRVLAAGDGAARILAVIYTPV
ncbi:MAG: cupin domain-containing protein [Treponema sp.]|jgi:quercetin dioxygenase-like cupin family protein/DNA-binding XRE family transcriptional regulator|nr:cupin domain-containing protein [Treponema sp.]